MEELKQLAFLLEYSPEPLFEPCMERSVNSGKQDPLHMHPSHIETFIDARLVNFVVPMQMYLHGSCMHHLYK
jgi:hypothetical protein